MLHLHNSILVIRVLLVSCTWHPMRLGCILPLTLPRKSVKLFYHGFTHFLQKNNILTYFNQGTGKICPDSNAFMIVKPPRIALSWYSEWRKCTNKLLLTLSNTFSNPQQPNILCNQKNHCMVYSYAMHWLIVELSYCDVSNPLKIW